MDKQIIVRIKAKQIVNNEEEAVELITPGKFYTKNGSYYIVYEETEISGLEGTTTTLKVSDKEVQMIRFGTTNSKLTFREGCVDTSYYKMPFGMIELIIKPSSISITMGDNGGSIELKYELMAGGSQMSRNELYIQVEQRE